MKLLKRLFKLFKKQEVILKEINERNGYKRIWKHLESHWDMKQLTI